MKKLILFSILPVFLMVFLSGCSSHNKGQKSKEELRSMADSITKDIGNVSQINSGELDKKSKENDKRAIDLIGYLIDLIKKGENRKAIDIDFNSLEVTQQKEAIFRIILKKEGQDKEVWIKTAEVIDRKTYDVGRELMEVRKQILSENRDVIDEKKVNDKNIPECPHPVLQTISAKTVMVCAKSKIEVAKTKLITAG
ncbi:MAG: hypothetical protein NTX61_03975 [Bacteroidetes bacterium]|nr:hypothetical protein [Bacteroidota bacterium]